MKIYFAGPLFTQAERGWNAKVAKVLAAAGHTVWLPQDQARDIVKSTTRLTDDERRQLFTVAVDCVRQCDVVVAVLDGSDADSGTCFECGVAFAFDRPVIGVRTDLRLGGEDGDNAVNLMLSQSCRALIWRDAASFAQTPETVGGLVLTAIDRKM